MFAFCATRSSCLASANAAPIERLGVRKHTVYRAEKRRKLNELRVVGSPDIVGTCINWRVNRFCYDDLCTVRFSKTKHAMLVKTEQVEEARVEWLVCN